MKTAKEILADNAWLFEQRRLRLTALARQDPERHPPEKRTWWDWEEIRRREEGDRPDDSAAVARLYRAMCLAPTIEICEALLRGEQVPLDRLNQEAVLRYGLR
jgi:hypothetical protein